MTLAKAAMRRFQERQPLKMCARSFSVGQEIMMRNGESHDVAHRHAEVRFIIANIVETSRSAATQEKQGTLGGLP